MKVIALDANANPIKIEAKRKFVIFLFCLDFSMVKKDTKIKQDQVASINNVPPIKNVNGVLKKSKIAY